MSVVSTQTAVADALAGSSAATFVFDSTTAAPFSPSQKVDNVYAFETRAGAGTALAAFVGKLGAAEKKPVAVLGSTSSLLALVPALSSLPASGRAPLSVHLSAQTSSLATGSLAQVPDLPAFFAAIEALAPATEFTPTVLLSETAEQARYVAQVVAPALAEEGKDLVHVFDGLTARETSLPSASAATGAEPLSYTGPAAASTVIVLPASAYSANFRSALSGASTSIGLLTVGAFPLAGDKLAAALPKEASKVYTLPGVLASSLRAALLDAGAAVRVRALEVDFDATPSVATALAAVHALPGGAGAVAQSTLGKDAKLAVFWSADATSLGGAVAKSFAGPKSGVVPRLASRFDNFAAGGLVQEALLLSPAGASAAENVQIALETSEAGFALVLNPAATLKAYNVFTTLGAGSAVVLNASWTSAAEASEKIPLAVRASAQKSGARVYVVDADKIAKEAGKGAVSREAVAQAAFWTLYLASGKASVVASVVHGLEAFAAADNAAVDAVLAAVQAAIAAPVVLDATPREGEEAVAIPAQIAATGAGPAAFPKASFDAPPASSGAWHEVAKKLMFPEAYGLVSGEEERLRPDLPERNYLVTVTENRRLTPNTYDRNVFHLEFSTAGTGLKYAVGEALGIHGWNDTAEVEEFLREYGLDGSQVVEFASREDPEKVEVRTVFQVFQQNLDIFGKPGKSFYETLSKHATVREEARTLRFISSPEGASTFKKWSDNETVTYADVLRAFPSAKLGLTQLLEEVEQIKPRHYSIASAQNFVGDSVHLLIVTVEWLNSKGSPRFGQCTRYLEALKPGQKVTVSIKPSVMKLPPLDTQPIIMAGLGTGAAPFRAFIQERAWRKAQGIEVGELVYYFGSRYRSKEYLYGEEIEAYFQEGIVSHTGLAFSRDTKDKVYIQHKMNEDAGLLADLMIKKNGLFTLCGPTWPVPDVTEALVKSFVSTKSVKDREAAEHLLEELKEKELFVLEVY